ncbi:hypothetical protein [Streptomyces aquilus]|uniref:hypothetical protein n=1 Tax=Streptomyces aquilus TaxID=2548456 RepID=UPI00368A9903
MFAKKHRSKSVLTLGAAITATALAVTMAPAAHAAEPTDAQISAAIQRHFDGTWTQADVNLIRSIPELAAVVPNVTRPVESTTESVVTTSEGLSWRDQATLALELKRAKAQGTLPGPEAQLSVASEEVETPAEVEVDSAPTTDVDGPIPFAAGNKRWKTTHVYHTHRSYTGAIIFRYHTYAEFQYDGSKVLKWGSRYDDFTNFDAGVDVNIGDRLLVNTKSRTPASSGSSMMKRQVQLCVLRYGCYSTLHPWAQVKVYGTGKTKIGGTGV